VLQEFLEGGLDFQLVKQTIEWKAPARFDQVLELSIAATRLGNTSFTVFTEFRVAGGDGSVIVTVDNLNEEPVGKNHTVNPSFDNTLLALEKSGQLLDRATTVFFNLVGADTNDARNKLRNDYAPRFSAHSDAIQLNGKLFARIQSLHERRAQLGLDAESQRLVERYYTDFVRAGAKLNAESKTRLSQINQQLAGLYTRFSQNLLAEETDQFLELESVASRDRHADGDVLLAGQAMQQHVERGEQRHEQRRLLSMPQRLQSLGEFLCDLELDPFAFETCHRRPWPVRRQIENRKLRQRRRPVAQQPFQFFAREQLPLPIGIVGVLHRQLAQRRVFAARECDIELG